VVLSSVFSSPIFDKALERLDGLGHLTTSDLEDFEHGDVIVRCERCAHELVQVCHVVRAILLVLRGAQGVQCITHALGICGGRVKRRRERGGIRGREAGRDMRHRFELDLAFPSAPLLVDLDEPQSSNLDRVL
jgi:hypothetical protein